MTDILPNITEITAIKVLGDFLKTAVGCEVIKGQNNRTAMPKGEFIVMTPRSMVALANTVNGFLATTKTILRPAQFTVQLDFYGATGPDRCNTVASLLWDAVGVEFFESCGYDMQTLYTGDAHQMPLITGENQYLERWTMDAVLQINQIITLPTETANTLTVDFINVDAAFPA